MLLVKKWAGHLINITKHVISSKLHVKVWIFQCEMDYK